MTIPIPQKHILLSSVGISGAKPTDYINGSDTKRANFSAFGLLQLIPQSNRPDEVWFLLTPSAKEKTWPSIVEDATRFGISSVAVDLTGSDDDTKDFLEQTAMVLPYGCRLTLNVTEGLRHHAFLFYALALYLTSFRNVQIEGVWYCRLETEEKNTPKPLIDLKPVLKLSRWFHALEVLRETGSLRPISKLMSIDSESCHSLNDLSTFFLNGMPLEAGNVAARLNRLAQNTKLVSGVPLAENLHETILKEILPLAGREFAPNPELDQESKKQLPLNDEELDRQSIFIDRYFETEQLNLAFGLLREWIVNWIARSFSKSPHWLEREFREKVEHSLGGLAEVYKSKDPSDTKKKRYKHAIVREQLSENQIAWAKRWSTICDIRNALQHHGMKATTFEPFRSDIKRAKDDWAARETWCELPNIGGGHGLLLICPIGHTPGVLYSALQHVKPSRALVICSSESDKGADDAVSKVPNEVEVTKLTLNNPHTGLDEFDSLLGKAALWIFQADEIHSALTGGTSLMGVLISRLNQRAQREYQRIVREFVLIDRRPPDTQRMEPWVLGDIHYLDNAERNDSAKKS